MLRQDDRQLLHFMDASLIAVMSSDVTHFLSRASIHLLHAVFASTLVAGTLIFAPAATAVLSCGSPGPVTISNESDLRDLATNDDCWVAGFTFTQSDDIELSGSWTTPIGNVINRFAGIYDGNGKEIRGLSVSSSSDTSYVGLFGNTSGATLKNIELTAVTISTSALTEYVGGIVGAAENTDILNSSVAGIIQGTHYVGGIAGSATDGSLISASTTAGSVGGADSGVCIGGIVGSIEESELLNVSSAANMRNNSVDGMELGGVVGVSHNSSITNASASGSVTGGQFSGGLVGAFRTIDNDAAGTFTLSHSHATGAVQASDSGAGGIGGLVGKFQSVLPSGDSTIVVSNSYATGSVTAAGDRVGGLIGEVYLLRGGTPVRNLNFTLSESYATGAVTGDDQAGGLVGYTFLNIQSSESTVTLNGNFSTGPVEGNIAAGGLIGEIDGGHIADSYATGAVSGVGEEPLIGGFAGYIQGGSSITNSHATGDVMVLGDDGYGTGGFFGLAKEDTSISTSFSSGNVDGRLGENTGGFGGFFRDGSINQSYATGAVFGSDFTGGLIGYSGLVATAEVSDSYAQGQVTGSRYVGSVIGSAQDGTVVTRTYGSAAVSGASNVGGAFGQVEEAGSPTSVSQTHWNSQVTGLTAAVASTTGTPTLTGVVGLTTLEMRSSSSFSDWDFTTIWGYDCSSSIYPQLRDINIRAEASSCPLPAPDSGGSSQPAPVPVGTVTSATANPVNTAVSPPIASQRPGSAIMLIGGRPVSVQSQPMARGRGLTLNAGPVSINLRGTTSSGQSVPLAPDGTLLLARSGDLPVTAFGLAPGSIVTQTLFSDPITLGSPRTNDAGELASAVRIPATVSLGEHTLRLQGTTNAGEQFTLDIGVSVATPAAALGANPILSVKREVVRGAYVLNIRARGVQARCLVTFTAGSQQSTARADRGGGANARFKIHNAGERTVSVHARVSGKGCVPVQVSRRNR